MAQVLNIKKLKITCQRCKSELIIPLGRCAYVCSVCDNAFVDNPQDSFYLRLYKVIDEMKNHPSATFELISDEKEK